MRLAIIGTGYVGLVTGVCLAEIGHEVLCVDIDEAKIKRLQQGEVPIFEPGLADLLHQNRDAGRLKFATRLQAKDAPEAIFFALPTPPNGDGEADLSFMLTAAATVAKVLKNYTVLINKSTVPVGTTKKVAEEVAKHTKTPFDVVSNPEFLREGRAVNDFLNPDRIVVGASSARARAVMEEMYRPFTNDAAEHPTTLLFMDEASAEMTKYAANSFLALKVSFINEIANLCELVGADVEDVRQGMGMDQRIGLNHLNPGLGYGGSCFPKDIMALARVAVRHGYEFKILESVMVVNERQRIMIVEKILGRLGENLSGKTIAVWGLAFKPDTDDIRHAPALAIIPELVQAGARIQTYDPEAMPNARRVLGEQNIVYAKSARQALEGADALVIVTEWKEFVTVEPALLAQKLKTRQVFDGRNIYNPATMRKAGLTYVSIGRQPVEGRPRKQSS